MSALSCTVTVDGVRLADGGDPADAEDEPTALDGLRVTWGRSTTLDQPSPATCALTVLDRRGGAPVAQLLATGRRLDVLTQATVYPDPTVPTITDPGFTTTGPGSVTSNGSTAVVGGRAVVSTDDPARRVRVIFPPAPFDDGGHPAAWDAIPRTAAGQSWRYGATVTLPPQLGAAGIAAAVVHPVAFTAPLAAAATVLADALPVPAGTVGPAVVAATFTPPPGVWLGVAVDLWPTGPTWDQLPPTLTWDQVPPTLTWDQLAQFQIDDLVVLAPAAGTVRAALVFSGRITDVTATYDLERAATVWKVTAQDHTAELANRDVADQPWPVETLEVRAQRIVTLSGQPTTLVVDPGITATQVTARDVDAQPALRMLTELAVSADAVLWSAVHLTTGQYLRLEDTAARPPLLRLAKGTDGVIRIVARTTVPGAIVLNACDVLLEPVEWITDVADVSSRVAVRWLEQTVGTDGKPDTAEHTETITDPAMVARIGVRRIGIGTQLISSAAAGELASRVLGRTSSLAYRVTGVVWDTGLEPLTPGQVDSAFRLLDGTTRNGAPLIVTDLPDWTPSGTSLGMFLEGGTYTFTAAAWLLDMTVSRGAGQGGGVRWDELDPTWRWDELDPTIRWVDLAGVAGPNTA